MKITIDRVCRLTLMIILTCGASALHAQGHIPVFPEQEGDALILSIQESYSPTEYLTYSDARDTLFANIYADDQDSLSAIFTDHTIYLEPGLDPTQAAFMNGAPDGINTEHLWPQSKGAGQEPARMDMHNLYPARIQVNSDRASLPFLDIEDQETVEWYFKDQTMTQIPSMGIDLYSERSEEAFEPRESVKGNIARTMFYFRTIYSEMADSSFFDLQRETLCTWHIDDPVDSLEWLHNQLKAMYQGNLNPFILDCSTVKRAFCPGLPPCTVSSEAPDFFQSPPELYPNPAADRAVLSFHTRKHARYKIQVMDMTGRLVYASSSRSTRGKVTHQLEVQSFPPGIYQVLLEIETDRQFKRLPFKLIRTR